MKNQFVYLFVIMLSFFACTKEDSRLTLTEEAQKTLLENEKKKSQLNNLDDPEAEPMDLPEIQAVQGFAGLTNVDVNSLSISQKYVLADDMIENSVDLLKNSYGLTNADIIDIYGSLDAPEIGAAGMLLTAIQSNLLYYSNISNPCSQKTKAIRCLVEAALPCTIITTLVNMANGTSTKIDVKWLLGMLKDISSLGSYADPRKKLIEVAADFGFCMFFDFAEPTYDPEAATPVGNGPSGYLVDPEAAPGFCVLEYPYYAYIISTKYFTPTELEVLSISNFNAKTATTLYYNSGDHKFYKESSFTNLVDDGFYNSGCDSLFQFCKVFMYIESGQPSYVVRRYYL